ncbi:MAG: PucR family transcriptional regulator ligand-binding domain-containing protein [Eubacteriales bacterium]
MGIILREVMNKFRDMEVVLVAGNNGIYNMVTWIHMVENVELSTFLEGGEIAVTTGIGMGEDIKLIEIVEGAYEHNASAMIINVGPYIQEIPLEVIEFANKHDFPIFQVPWEIYMAEIMRTIAHEISVSETKSIELETAMQNAIFMPSQPELYREQLTNRMFDVSWCYRIAIIKVYQKNQVQEFVTKGMNHNKNLLRAILRHNYKNTVIIIRNDEIIVAMAHYDRNDIEQIVEYTKRQLLGGLSDDQYVRTTVGGEYEGIEDIYKSYNQSKKMFGIFSESQKQEISFYDDIGVHKLLLAIEDNEVIKQYITDIIEPIHVQDEVNQTDLLMTLKCYLRHSGSVKEAAAELFVHRNTINYKVKKIEELLKINLSDLEIQTKLSIGILLYDMYSK